MSQENVEVVRKATDAFNRLDLDAFLALLSPDVEWGVNPELPGLREIYRGRAEVREMYEELLEVAKSSHTALGEVTELSDDGGLAETVLTGRGKASELPFEIRYWQLLRVEGGEIVRRQVFTERDAALEAAGLSE